MLLLLEFGLARSFDIYQKQSFLSLGSDDTADMEPWCTYAAIVIKFPRNPIDNQHRQSEDSFENPLGRAKRQKINKYTTRGVNTAAVQVLVSDRFFPSICKLALTQPEGKYSSKWDVW
jgi:hypothetical protein